MPESPKAIVVGSSAGGRDVLVGVLSSLAPDFPLPILICSHLHASNDGLYVEQMDQRSALTVTEARDKQPIEPGMVYVAPPNYHLLVERDRTLALSTAEKVQWSRPSIDVLFESAAYVFTASLVGILLSGANDDGAVGLGIIRELGGLTIVQDPSTAEHPEMPRAAVERKAASKVLSPEEIRDFVAEFGPREPRGE